MTADSRPQANSTIYLLRHGETEWSAAGRHTGITDVELTDRGRNQARRAGELLGELRGDAEEPLVLISPRSRATQTAELAGLRGTVLPELAEWDYGDYEGLTTPEIRTRVPDWTVWTHPIPGGESADQVGDRADGVAALARRQAGGRDIVLVAHGHLLRVFLARALGLPPTEGVRFYLRTAAVSILGEERSVTQLLGLNLR
ncbi:acid phosphatase [Actinoalloteichus hymeniacidonis]|uniref:Fructose-2,6-bisphosphatase n=1 Tax=Actinoalloteichus hymeniacidonis TaxID=340345 RepID=A0AAC9HU75_9PSEU|nr:acid phosphatase [Actinoalloteichus hymeniacidonis]AOS65409.1 fructose-2,6-bisphosphatase [Actinoalloteichus hymeniacidonis]MBB5906505.1 putative phosphoglycerate mutase [Actinoalloteichus hymeniacidonis]